MLRLFTLVSLLFTSVSHADTRGQQEYEKTVLPLLQQFCYDCHSDGVKKGKFALDEHSDYPALLRDQKLWDHVRQMMVTHVMPPLDKDKPTQEQRDHLIRWIDANAFYYDPAQPDPGHVTLRRLNRTEYNNTIRDIFGIYDYKGSIEFPQDDTGYGYDNIGDVLKISPLLMEKYLRAGRKVAEQVLEMRYPERADTELGAKKFSTKKDRSETSDGVLWFSSEATADTYFKVPTDGTYTFTLHAAQAPGGDEGSKVAAKLDGKLTGEFEIHKEWKQNGGYEYHYFSTRLSKGTHKLSLSFLNDWYDEKAPPGRNDRNLAIDKVELSGPSSLMAPQDSSFLRWLEPRLATSLPSLDLSGEDLLTGEGPSVRDTGAMLLQSSGYVYYPVELSQAGNYRAKLKLGAMQAGDEPTSYELRLGDQVLMKGEVTAKNQAPQWFEQDLQLPQGSHQLRVAFTNDFFDPQTNADRNLWIHEIHLTGPLKPAAALSAKELPPLLSKMAQRLFRRPITPEELTKWQAFAQSCTDAGESVRSTVGLCIEGMLCSPAFLFRSAPTPVGQPLGQTQLIDEYALASRLSYFLWAAPPDEELLALAAAGQLRTKLQPTVKRMLLDWRASSLQQDFAGQWLQLRDTELINPSKRFAPEWQGSLSYYMRRETEQLFHHILTQNFSVIRFLDADYTFLNKPLAKWYGIDSKEVQKAEDKSDFVKVSLQGTPRAGILTHGSVLAITSNPTRTNIVRRGKFLLENILGAPPPPVPGDIPPLDEEKLRRSKLTLRQEFEAHRHATACAGCHAYLDPMGFALEQYDALGRFRTKDHGQPVDTAGQLVRGQQFQDFAQLRDILVRDYSADFTRTLAENLLTYALGRGLQYYDRPAVAQIVASTQAEGWKLQDLIQAVCQSVPFQRMRVE